MDNRGFSLVTVTVLSLFIFILGITGLYIIMMNIKSTQADISFNLAEKASNAGLMRAFDEINKTGAGGSDRTISGSVGDASYRASIMFGGKNIWFISSEGTFRNSRVVRTAIFQGYYGVGLYTVRGRVNASIAGARLSGCDSTSTPVCFVPAFIASGTINTPGVTPRQCTSDSGGSGIYGQEPILNLDQGDLSRIFFKVKCFNKHNKSQCDLSLLDYIEYDYGRDPDLNTSDNKFLSFNQNNDGYGIPIITIPQMPTTPSVPASCSFNATSGGINLSTQFTNCDKIVLFRSPASSITGNGLRGNKKIEIYSQNYTTTFDNASNFKLFSNNNTTIQNNSNNFELLSSGPANISSANNFKVYTTGTVTLNNINRGIVISTNTVYAAAGANINNSKIVLGFPTNATDSQKNNVNAPQNFVFNGNATIGNATEDNNPNIIIARSLRFANNSSVNILNSLVYVYAYACPSCSRTTADSSLNACDNNSLWCGWYGSGVSLNIGRTSSNNPNPVLFISNNTTVRIDSPVGTVYIWGVWYGEDITYLRWINPSSQDLRGFLIRNFPPDQSLNINISSGFTLTFSKNIIDTISRRYRFFREVECVRDPLTPQAQMIQTRTINY